MKDLGWIHNNVDSILFLRHVGYVGNLAQFDRSLALRSLLISLVELQVMSAKSEPTIE